MSPKPHILMCPPDFYGIEYEINAWMSRARPAESAVAREQWEGLRRTLETAGATISLVEPRPGLPDLVFTANAFALMGLRQLYFMLHGLLDRLIYLSKGLAIILGIAAIGVLIVFQANLTTLIQLYIIGVFVSFTVSQTGMIRHWNRLLRTAAPAEAGKMRRSAPAVSNTTTTPGVVTVAPCTAAASRPFFTATLLTPPP